MGEEKGLTLWNPSRDILLSDLAKRKCACGAPAVTAVRRLDDPGDLRVYLCGVCRPRRAPLRERAVQA
jgi:hypothetical protein